MQGLLRTWSARRTRLLDRLAAWRAGLIATEADFLAPPDPDPSLIGRAERGQSLLAGHLRFGGARAEARGRSPWAVEPPSPAFLAELHGFAWLDDLAAVGTPAAAERARAWVADWLRRYGRGGGGGWTPALAGRRLQRLIAHGRMLTGGPPALTAALRRALARHVAFLAKRAEAAPAGLPRLDAWLALLHAGLALRGQEGLLPSAEAAIARIAAETIAPDGGVASRCPEELLQLFDRLTAAAVALVAAGRSPGPAHLAAIERAAPVLRACRHADGGLARFHGGARGPEGVLERALAASALRPTVPPAVAMGYARLAAGRTTVIADVAAPPGGDFSANAHASTLAFELTSGRRPVIVSCGPGLSFGPDWHKAGRATASHATLAIEGYSSSRLGPGGRLIASARARLIEAPRPGGPGGGAGLRLQASHDGYVATHGLVHTRRLELSADGRTLLGEDALAAVSKADQRRLARVVARSGGDGVHFVLHFHLHPDAEVDAEDGGDAAWIALKSGEVWVLRHDGMSRLSVEPSVYLDPERPGPAATKQIVLAALLIDYAGRVSWNLSKSPETPLALRDLAGADDADAEGSP